MQPRQARAHSISCMLGNMRYMSAEDVAEWLASQFTCSRAGFVLAAYLPLSVSCEEVDIQDLIPAAVFEHNKDAWPWTSCC